MANTGGGPGGYRTGNQGSQYPNRSDLRQNAQAPHAATGQTYGKAQEQEQAQQIIPLPKVTPLDAPTERPDEPITAGLPSGPGPGPGPQLMPAPADTIRAKLGALYQANPNNDLLRLIELHDMGY